MKAIKILKISLRSILHSKLRSWLTIIGIVIGVAAVISIVSIGEGFEKNIQEQLGGFGSDTISILPGFDKAYDSTHGPPTQTTSQNTGVNPLSDKEVQTLRSISEIESISASIEGSATAYYLGESTSLAISGVDPPDWRELTTMDLESGRLLSSSDKNSIIIGSSIADGIFENKVSVNRQLIIDGKAFRVVGISEAGGSFGSNDNKVYMHIDSARTILGASQNEYDSIQVNVRDPDQIEYVVSLIERKLMILRKVTDDTKDFTIISMKAVQEQVSAILQGFTMFLTIIAAVSLLVGAVGIANTMFTSVLEKTKEIGIMKSLGAKNSDIMFIFLLNSGLVGLVGGILGVIFGIVLSIGITAAGFSFGPSADPITTEITFGLVTFALFFSVFIGMLSGIIPAYRASKLNPVDALRYE
jgi:putative ABC transport system permease protein